MGNGEMCACVRWLLGVCENKGCDNSHTNKTHNTNTHTGGQGYARRPRAPVHGAERAALGVQGHFVGRADLLVFLSKMGGEGVSFGFPFLVAAGGGR